MEDNGAGRIRYRMVFLFVRDHVLRRNERAFVRQRLFHVRVFSVRRPRAFRVGVPIWRVILDLRVFSKRLVVILLKVTRIFATREGFNGTPFCLRSHVSNNVNLFKEASSRNGRANGVILVNFTRFLTTFIFRRMVVTVSRARSDLMWLCSVRKAILFVNSSVRNRREDRPLLVRNDGRLNRFILHSWLISFDGLIFSQNVAIFVRFRTIRPRHRRRAGLLPSTPLLPKYLARAFSGDASLFLVIVPRLIRYARANVFQFRQVVLRPAAADVLVRVNPQDRDHIRINRISDIVLYDLLREDFTTPRRYNRSDNGGQCCRWLFRFIRHLVVRFVQRECAG